MQPFRIEIPPADVEYLHDRAFFGPLQ